MNTHIQSNRTIVEAFELMWGAYPAPASLVHKSRTIIAVNAACLAGGRKPGMNCATWSSADVHKGCLANRALAEQKTLYKEIRQVERVFRAYWLPVPGYPDLYIHFTTEPINTAKITLQD